MHENLIERYLTDLLEVRSTRANAPETSFYPALEHLLTSLGKSLNPKVRCVINLADRGAGLPDGGLFTADQFGRKARSSNDKENPLASQNPSRGVIEAKSPSAEVAQIAGSEQVERYWKKYGMVLVTNFRSFALVGKNPTGQPVILESFSLGGSEKEFWQLAAHPNKTAETQGERMLEYLRRVLLHNAPLADPKDVATILASYAHDARLRIEQANLPALSNLRSALEDSLGLHFDGDRGEHFFRSTLVQTLFYGVFSAWVLWARRKDIRQSKRSFADRIHDGQAAYTDSGIFDWKSAHWLLRVPMLRGLFVQVADPARLGSLGLIEVLDWTAATLNRVDRSAFFRSFDEGHAVQYFYEPFLHAFDPELRKELGVWYTPEEIVTYQVERVDAVLRSELNLPDGLADPNVVVLDPCCGTGAYLRAVLRRIAATLHDKGGDALVAHDLKKAAMERVFGFEILPAPFVIAHLQISLELETLGAPLSDVSDPPERAGVYLTNALTGWDPPKEKPKQIAFPGFQEERDAAGKVKQEKPILVILGNPPYNAFAGISPEEESGLVEPYKKGLISEWGIKKFNLDELYVRFFRLAERRIAEKGGRGVVSFISNFSYLADPSFVVMRSRLLSDFDSLWIDCMNGDSRETGKTTPEGKPDPSVFSTEWNREGIRVGTTIGLFVKRKRAHDEGASVHFRHFWGGTKRADLLRSLETKNFNAQYENATPQNSNRWSFRPSNVASAYREWPAITDLCAREPLNGPIERRGNAMIVFDTEKEKLSILRAYLDPKRRDEEIRAIEPRLMFSSGEFKAEKTRSMLKGKVVFSVAKIVRYPFKPFDIRCAYLDNELQPLFSRPSPELLQQRFDDNCFLVLRENGDVEPQSPPLLFSRLVCDYHTLAVEAKHIPFMLRASLSGLPDLYANNDRPTANLSAAARAYIAALSFPDPDTTKTSAEAIWYHTLAIGYAPAYLAANTDGIRQDWLRVPLPQKKADLVVSVDLGRRVAALLDQETQVQSVTTGKIRDDLKTVAVFERTDGKPAKPEAGDLDLTAGWGHAGKGGITMPGKGLARENDGVLDIYLNEKTRWRNVPRAVWEYTIGGYQVIKKWLSYREKDLLGRGLTPEEVRYVTEMARRIEALIALQPALDENYRQVIKSTYPWSQSA